MQHTCFRQGTKKQLEAISKYNAGITEKDFQDPKKQRDLTDILLYHPDPITRHEAAFIIGEHYQDLYPFLITALKFDTSIVCKHEAAEALGKVKGPEARRVQRYLERMMRPGYDEAVYHSDVQATIQHAVSQLAAEIQKQSL